MKISLVTISFNQAAYLEQAIRSVMEQNYPDLEYIVVDPGSTDGSREIIERYRNRISQVIFEPDQGPADGLNRGFACASGDVFGYLNSDDRLLPGALARVGEAFRACPAADLVYGHGYVIDRTGNVLRRCRSDRFNLRRSAYGNSIIMQQAAFWRREAFMAAKGFNAANRLSWDGEFWIDLALAGKYFHRVDEYWACFRAHEDSITHHFHGGSGQSPFGVEQRRLLEKALGRPYWAGDAAAAALTRVEKWLADPVNLWLRLQGLFEVRPRILPGSRGTTDRSS
ncbi:MAG TPA: glycosyltransferase family 2 protein [Rhizomicrobium sp.]|nr:glycosyltransferase family 2 protein [Rhizomicrobium sp.]